MVNKVKIPIVVVMFGLVILVITFLYVSHFIISGTILTIGQANSINSINEINKPVAEKVYVNTSYPFKVGSTYMGIQGNERIEIANINNKVEEFNLNNNDRKYILKAVENTNGVGYQFNRYYNNNLVGKYNLLKKGGNWVGVYTDNANEVYNVVISSQ